MSQSSAQTLPHARPSAGIAPRHAFAALREMIATARSRRQLAALSEQRLADLGLTPAEAAREAQRPFWDAPRAWLR